MVNEKHYSDFSSLGEIDDNGSLRLLTGHEAVENALRLWIASFRGELIRNPDRGGYIVQWLAKPMSEEVGLRIKEAIEDGLFEDFEPRVSIQRLTVTPYYEQSFWKIELEGYVPAIREQFKLSEKLRRLI